ncbi:MAG: multiheme c-type cytochrome, partial [Lacipirellulaceae bacterium]
PGWITLASEPELLSEPTLEELPSVETHNDAQVQATSFDDSLLEEDDLLGDTDDLLAAPADPPSLEELPQPKDPEPKDDAESLLDARDDLLTPEPSGDANPRLAPGPSATQEREPHAQASPSPQRKLGVAPPTTNNNANQLFAPPRQSTPNPHANASQNTRPKTQQERCQFVADSLYPEAASCKTCHEKIYDEWSISSHAYAAVSPMFQKFEQTINDITHGTVGYFCLRCHSPVGTALNIDRTTPLWDQPQVAREGITCVACHRINEAYSKTNGQRHIVPGDIYAPVYGSIGGHGVAEVIAKKNDYKVKVDPANKKPGQPIHRAGVRFPQLAKSEFCTTCHQVAVHPGIKLEVVWEQYRASPACKKGVSCQDCHMGRIPGVASGYEVGAAAIVNKKKVNEHRKHSNHTFYGPGYSIAHPGIFPWNTKAQRWTMQEWLLFDWRAGWGTKEFEDALDDNLIHVSFPKVWDDVDDRMDAREIVEDNQKKLAHKNELRRAVLENGSHIDGPFFKHPPRLGQDLKFSYTVINTNDGHNLPTASLGAQPQLWANVVLIGPDGQRLWETGYLDPNGDLADIHSLYVRHKKTPFDWQLFNLQTMFLITGVKGTDRELPLPVNVSIDQLPFLRPGAQPISTINHPPFIRMESRSLPALGSRTVPYKIPAELIRQPGRYRLSFRMRSRAEPPYFMRFCSSTPEMIRRMTEGIMDFHQSSFEFVVR